MLAVKLTVASLSSNSDTCGTNNLAADVCVYAVSKSYIMTHTYGHIVCAMSPGEYAVSKSYRTF